MHSAIIFVMHSAIPAMHSVISIHSTTTLKANKSPFHFPKLEGSGLVTLKLEAAKKAEVAAVRASPLC
jgi:hypothetical protein